MFLNFSFKKLFSSFKFAISGIKIIFREEQTFRTQISIAILVTIAIFYFNLSPTESIVIFTIIFLVLMAELINSLFERILDIIRFSSDIRVKKIKDMSSGIVLLCSLAAAIIGILIFLPHLGKLLE